jgi:hypothetical protein
MIYLASPYSNDPDGNYQAMLGFCRRIFTLLPAPPIFSPVTYFHPIATSLGYEEVMGLCFHMIDLADDFWIVALPNWTVSEGVKNEAKYWISKGKKLTLVNPDSLQRIRPVPGPTNEWLQV